MDIMQIFIIIIIVATIAPLLAGLVKRKMVDKMAAAIAQGDFNTFYSLMNSNWRYLFPKTEREYMLFNAAIMQNDAEKIENQYQILKGYKMGKNLRRDIAAKAFQYYLLKEDKKTCQSIIEESEQLKDDELVYMFKRAYDINILNGYRYLNETLKEFREADDEITKATLALLLVQMYSNANDEAKEKEYMAIYNDLLNKRSNND